MLNTNILIAIACLSVLIIFLVYRIVSRKKTLLPSDNNLIHTEGDGRAVNRRTDETKKLTIQERVELSWKFLYEITDIIINRFSKADVNVVTKCGKILLDNGGKYEHVLDLAINQLKSRTQSVEQQQTQSKGQQALGV